ncbi:MAG TPA: hypothetical protein PKJ84_08870 [Anaerolineales bacterium]|nr:hypothetical protein [Anaerolineales bacterium]HNO94270.1 hypothetical protein [Anaerolineales bacterium]
MLRNFFYSKNSATKWLKKVDPNEELVFSSVASILETKESAPVGQSFKRFFQHSGVVLITQNQIAVKNSIFFLPTVFFGFLVFVSLLTILSKDENNLFGGILGLVVFSTPILRQCVPYKKQIPLQDIIKVKLSSVSGFTGKHQLFTITLKDKTLNIVPTQTMPGEVIELLSSPKK